jgi:hypothetical protein
VRGGRAHQLAHVLDRGPAVRLLEFAHGLTSY